MKESKKINVNVLIFTLVCILLTIDFFLTAYFKINRYENIIRYTSVVLIFVLFIVNRRITLNEILVLILFVFLFIIGSNVSTNIAYLLLLSLSAKYVDNKNLYKIINIINLIIVLVIIVCLSTGIVKNQVIYNRNRNTLGFIHVNYVGLLCYSIVSSYVLMKNNINKLETILLLLFTIIIVGISDSRTGCYGSIILIITYHLLKYLKPRFKKIVISLYSFLIFLFPLLIQTPILSNSVMEKLLTYRPYTYRAYMNRCTIRQLLIGGANGSTDCFYINTLFGCGIFIYIILCILMYKAVITKTNKNETAETAFILTTMLVGTMESSIMRPELLCIILFWKLIIENIYEG